MNSKQIDGIRISGDRARTSNRYPFQTVLRCLPTPNYRSATKDDELLAAQNLMLDAIFTTEVHAVQ